MSFYSIITGSITAKSTKGLEIIKRYYDSWTKPQNERYGSLVTYQGNAVVFNGYYRNAGSLIERCIVALRHAGELHNVDLEESTTDGFKGSYAYFVENGVPKRRITTEL